MTIPIMKATFYLFDNNPVIQLKFTDLDAKANSSHRFYLQGSSEFLTINKDNGEVNFHPNKWNQEKQKNFKAIVKNNESGALAKTKLKLKFLVIDKDSFCLKYACFYDNIHYKTTEFNMLQSNKEQIIGDVQPLIYRRICENLQVDYYLENGKIIYCVK